MIKPPLATTIASLLGVLAPAFMVTPALAEGGAGPDRQYSSSVAQRAIVRRREGVERGSAALDVAEKAMKEKDLETAFANYKLACDLIPAADNSAKLYKRAITGLCDSGVALAEQRITEGRYQDAQNILNTVLSDRYDPSCKRAIAVLAHLEEPDFYNKTITPRFRASVEQVKQLLVEAQGFFDRGSFDLAYKRCEQILAIDHYNIAAQKMEEKINVRRDDSAVQGYNNTRAYRIWQVTNAWTTPPRHYDSKNNGPIIQSETDRSRSIVIRRKLDSIIIPRLEFRDATIREAIDFLKKKSVDLDPEHQGVNIVLHLDSPAGSVPEVTPTASPSSLVIPGLESTTSAATPIASVPVPSSEARITVALSNIPLSEALRYVTSLANLKYKVEEYAVSVVPLSTVTDTPITREWKVPPGMFSSMATSSSSGSLDSGGGFASGASSPRDATKGGSSLVPRVDPKDTLTQYGVTFPPGTSAIFLPASSRLIVKNTQENLELVNSVVDAMGINAPTQIEIESKFVEITQNNLKELSFDWLLGQANVPGSSRVFAAGGTSGQSTAVNASDYPFPIGQQAPLTSGNRSGSAGISQNAIDALLFGATGGASAAPAVAAIAGVFTDPQFAVVIRALNQKKGVDLLSAPRVTTKSGQRAIIEIIREFRYPTEFEPPQIPQSVGTNQPSYIGGGGLGLGGLNPLAQQNQESFPVTPTTPTSFETRNTGVTLEVEPTVGADGITVDLTLAPQVVEFEGFINYGSPIQTTSTNALGQSVTNVITPNIINQPIFSTRKVQTAVTIYDGNTVVLGGLMREDVQKVEDKIPLLGDIPVLGRLFRSSIEQHLKRNLVIFVSARLINPAGEAVRSDDEVEEVVSPLPLPEAIEQELPYSPK